MLFPLCDQTRATCRPKSRCQSDLSTVSVLTNKNLHQDLMHSGCHGTAVPNVCLRAFWLFPLPSSPLDQRPVHKLFRSSLTRVLNQFYKQVKSIDVDKLGSKKHLASKSVSFRLELIASSFLDLIFKQARLSATVSVFLFTMVLLLMAQFSQIFSVE